MRFLTFLAMQSEARNCFIMSNFEPSKTWKAAPNSSIRTADGSVTGGTHWRGTGTGTGILVLIVSGSKRSPKAAGGLELRTGAKVQHVNLTGRTPVSLK
jgi:hypothetical protein